MYTFLKNSATYMEERQWLYFVNSPITNIKTFCNRKKITRVVQI